MPQNKQAQIRYKIIDARLRNKQKPKPTLQELINLVAEQLGKKISKSTIQKDIEAMRYDELLEFRAPIVYDNFSKGYSYEDSNYSISNLNLSPEQLYGLTFAMQILQQHQHIPAIKEFETTIQRLAATVKLNVGKINTPIIEIEKADIYMGLDWMNCLVTAIENKQLIKIKYKSFINPKSKEHIVAPYLIKEYNFRWYLISKSNKASSEQILTFAFDRIESIVVLHERFYNSEFDSKLFFNNVIGISHPHEAKPQKVELLFDRNQANYIITQPLHHTQKIIKETANGILIELNVILNYELMSTILSYGSAVTIVSPAELKSTVKVELKKVLQKM
jgi:predicted DNA-binding transcriptional regulator YafY